MSDAAPGDHSETMTRASIFLHLNRSDADSRELAWKQFYDQYAPVIAGYARQRGADAQQADEVVQNVIAGFFEASPRFVYNPERGRFRGYLRTCATHALNRLRTRLAHSTIPVEEIEHAAPDDSDELWDKLWQQQILRRAIDLAREHYRKKGSLKTFLAFEMNVLKDVPAAQCAAELEMSVASIHQAKTRVTQVLKEFRSTLTDEEG